MPASLPQQPVDPVYSFRVGYTPHAHTFLLLVNHARLSCPPAQEMHFYGRFRTEDKCLLTPEVYQNPQSQLSDFKSRVICQGDEMTLRKHWYRACHFASQIKALELPFCGDTQDCRAGVAMTLRALGHGTLGFIWRTCLFDMQWRDVAKQLQPLTETLPDDKRALIAQYRQMRKAIEPSPESARIKGIVL